MDPDPGGPKTYGSDGSGFGSGSATLATAEPVLKILQVRTGRQDMALVHK
jgi:hypothetical protein